MIMRLGEYLVRTQDFKLSVESLFEAFGQCANLIENECLGSKRARFSSGVQDTEIQYCTCEESPLTVTTKEKLQRLIETDIRILY